MTKKIIIYSHGFGVKKDSRGMFTDIASSMPDFEHIMFDFNVIEGDGTTFLTPIDGQAKILSEVIKDAVKNNSNADVFLISHSMGCVITSIVNPSGISKTIFLAPPSDLDTSRTIEYFSKREGTKIDLEGDSSIQRADGSTTVIPRQYWEQLDSIDMVDLYNGYRNQKNLHIIQAGSDDVLDIVNFDRLDKGIDVSVIAGANHNFTDNSREPLIEKIKALL